MIETVVFTLLIFLLFRLAIQNFDIDGYSMEPTLHNGQLILVDKVSFLLHPPQRGDIVVFAAPPHPNEDYIKRIIGLPGDVITIQNTTVIVDGTTLHETYISPQNQGNPYPSFTNLVVPPNTYFVLGDNREGSSDSRDWGCVPRQNIIGRAALVYWPLDSNNEGLLPNVSPVFAHVHPSPLASTATTPNNICPVIPPPARASTSQPIQPLSTDSLLLLIPPALLAINRKRE
jgi:signal peptidase I